MSTRRVDRRKQERRASSLYLQFLDSRTGEPVGALSDISRDGFMLESMKPIPRNLEFSFRIALPPEIAQKTFLVFTARSLWSKPDTIDTRLYDTGFEITSMDPGDVRTFELMIERYGSKRTGRNTSNDYFWKD